MAKLNFWDKKSDMQFPAGFYTAEEYMRKEPWTRLGQVVVEVQRGVTIGVYNFGVLCNNYQVPENLDDDAALTYIQQQIDEQRRQAEEAAQQPTAEERIAAAMEFQNLSSL